MEDDVKEKILDERLVQHLEEPMGSSVLMWGPHTVASPVHCVPDFAISYPTVHILVSNT